MKGLFTLATIYAPNDDDPAFYESFFNHLRDFHCDDMVLGGDFNLVLNLEKDKKGGLAKTHTKAVTVINDHATKFDLVDAWRVSNPDIRRYTWRRRKPEIHCRLDFFLVSFLLSEVTSVFFESLKGFLILVVHLWFSPIQLGRPLLLLGLALEKLIKVAAMVKGAPCII